MKNTETGTYHVPDIQTQLLIAYLDILSWLIEEQHGVVTVESFIHYMAMEMRLEAVHGVVLMNLMVRQKVIQRIVASRTNFFMVSDIGMVVYNEAVEMAQNGSRPIREAVTIVNVGVPQQAQRMRRQRTRNMAEAFEMKMGDRYYCPACKANIHINDPNHDDICRGW